MCSTATRHLGHRHIRHMVLEDIRLVPTWSSSSVTTALMAALSRAVHLQAGVWQWTISDALLGDDLAKRLREDHGFVCVDLHLPTDVDALADLAARGAQVRIHHESIRTHTAHGRQEPPQLLHSKMLLSGRAIARRAVGRELDFCTRRVRLDFLEGERGTLGYLNRMAFERSVDVVQPRLVVAAIILDAAVTSR